MANIILKNRYGEPVVHENRTSVKLDTQEGGQVLFYEGGGVDNFKLLADRKIVTVTEDMLEGMTEIRRYLFDYCEHLSSIKLPSTIASIGERAFQGCSSLASINIPDGISYIGDFTFAGCSSLTSINIPDSVTTISRAAFQSCASLTSIIFPVINNLYIRANAFAFCIGITSLEIPNNVHLSSDTDANQTGNHFRFCEGLETVIYRSSSYLPNGVFYGCIRLRSITIPLSRVIQCGTDSLTNVPSDCIIYVPSSLVASYKSNSTWRATGRTDYVRAIPEE